MELSFGCYSIGVRDIKDPFPVNNRDLRQGQCQTTLFRGDN
jgi:hypothetical protein